MVQKCTPKPENNKICCLEQAENEKKTNSSPHVMKTKIRTREDYNSQTRINIQRGATISLRNKCNTRLWNSNNP